ncbi:hypothetical protein AK830_g2056 [Neonectria ditissima]|uniref:catechol O-methyltransferase n=1 Tax=Neonectria ditissima TaxID=78410 RepID=A0A0P7BXJ5_9HYPO|nr:hypothetical protein AK830_g2056 [Neonectria ditissima]
MAEFNQSKAYAAQEDVYYDDGREIELLHFVYGHPKLDEIRGSPKAVLAAIDEFGHTKKYLMNVGESKGKIVTDLIAEVELGGYVAYSAILFGEALRNAGGQRYFSLEQNPEFGAIIMSLVELAGLQDIVKVVVGSSAESLRRLHAEKQLTKIDLLFLDHHKPAYLPDLKLCEELQLIRAGSALAADNVIKPGNPPYLEYVRSSVDEKVARVNQAEAASNDPKPDTGAKQDAGKDEADGIDSGIQGNPRLVYKSELIRSFEPTGIPDGIEITHCQG